MRIAFSVVGNSPAMARLSNREIIVPGLPSLSKFNLINLDSDMAMLNTVYLSSFSRPAEALRLKSVGQFSARRNRKILCGYQ
jgi:hypothetical protein